MREGNLSYLVRAIRTRDFLYIRNLRPDRWPAGDPQIWFAFGDFGDVDDTPAKQQIIQHPTDPKIKPFFDLCFAKRPPEELYDLRRDADQLNNVAQQNEYAKTRTALSARVDQWMKETQDPRVDSNYDAWDTYPYFGGRPSEVRGRK